MGAMSLSLSLSAQPGIIQTRPSNDASGKILTMEETILSQSLAPANLWCRWTDNDHIAMFAEGRWVNYDIATADTVKYVPKAKPTPLPSVKRGDILAYSYDGGCRIFALTERTRYFEHQAVLFEQDAILR